MEISKNDWKLYREKLPEWQENYMDKLCKEYIELLKSDKMASDRFWELEDKIKEDRTSPGVMLKLSKSETYFQLLSLINDHVITMDDLSDFSEELRNDIKRYFE